MRHRLIILAILLPAVAQAGEPVGLTFNFAPQSSHGDTLAFAVERDLLTDWDGWQARVNPQAWAGLTPEQRFTALGQLWALHERAAAIRRRYAVTVLRSDEHPHPAYRVGTRYAQWHALPDDVRSTPTLWLRFAEWIRDSARDNRQARWERGRERLIEHCLTESGWTSHVGQVARQWVDDHRDDDTYYSTTIHDRGRIISAHTGGFGDERVTLLAADLGLAPPAVALPAQWSTPPEPLPCPLDRPTR